MKAVAISLGGSVVNPGKVNVSFINAMADLIDSIDMKLLIIVGGGSPARESASVVINLSNMNALGDEVAIHETRKNAYFVLSSLIGKGVDVYPKVFTSFDEAVVAFQNHKVVVGGGLIPGFTTDAVTTVLADRLGIRRLINVSNVDGVYTSNPSKDPSAKLIESMTHDDLVKMAQTYDSRGVGEHFVFDVIASKLAKRSNIEIRFVSASNLEEIKKAILGEKHKGTIVTSK